MSINALKVLFAAVALCGPAWAACGQQADIEQWLRSEWKRAETFPSLGQFGVKYRYETPVAPGELERLKAEIAQHPDHPGRAQAKLLEFAKDGFLTRRYCLFFENDMFWRYCQDSADGTFLDKSAAAGREWQLTEKQLWIYNPDETGPKAPRMIHEVNVFRPVVGRLLLAGFNLAVAGKLEILRVETSGERWSMTAGRPGDVPPQQRMTLRIEGTWDSTIRRGFVTSRTFVEHGYMQEAVGIIERYSGWSDTNAAQQWVAGKVEIFKPDGSLDRRIIFDEFVPLPVGGLEALTRTPSIGKLDVFRGESTYTSVTDYRSNTISTQTPTGEQTIRAIRTANQPVSDGGSWIRPLGWGICVAVVGTLIYLRTRRSVA